VNLTRAIAVAGLYCIMLGGCSSGAAYQPATYVVRPEDTLYSIAWRHNLDYRDLAKWNNLGADYRLAIGQVLALQASGEDRVPRVPSAPPVAAATVRPGTPPAATSAGVRGPRAADAPSVGKPVPLADSPAGTSATLTRPAPAAAPTAPPAAPPAAAPAANGAAAKALPPAASGTNAKWVWPTDPLSAPRAVPGGGILLLGRLGQDVRAAGPGRVVYTGSGLRGYGNLIIIKHGDSLLSSYAHNRELLVHEGQDVAAGQVIAHMGTGPHQVSALYFEIRVNGKPTDPLRYLR